MSVSVSCRVESVGYERHLADSGQRRNRHGELPQATGKYLILQLAYVLVVTACAPTKRERKSVRISRGDVLQQALSAATECNMMGYHLGNARDRQRCTIREPGKFAKGGVAAERKPKLASQPREGRSR